MQSGVGRFKVGLADSVGVEDSKWGRKIHSGARRFKMVLEDFKCGRKIQSGEETCQVGNDESKWGK